LTRSLEPEVGSNRAEGARIATEEKGGAMERILAVGTHATDDPTRASLPFITAAGAAAADLPVAIALLGDAAYLARPEVAKSVQGVGFPPLTDVMAGLLGSGVPVYV
jgi:predicted peroxiredoxin